MLRPESSEYDPYYERYIALVTDDDIVAVLEAQPVELANVVGGLPEEKGTYSYADGKWSIKEVLSHLIDAERMFAYRVFRIGRGDKTPIEGFDQEPYIENAYANGRPFTSLMKEFSLLREANLLFFKNLKDGDWIRTGTANEREISVRALAFTMAGHVRHHVQILNDRYLA